MPLITTIVELRSSFLLGQEELVSSSIIWDKKSLGVLNGFLILEVAGGEGFEPPTYGFGDRCSTN